jgi:hypothetical protein
VAGAFLAGYGAARFVGEFFRQPDAHLGFLFAGATGGARPGGRGGAQSGCRAAPAHAWKARGGRRRDGSISALGEAAVAGRSVGQPQPG